MRSMDDFKQVGKPDKVRIRFLRKTPTANPYLFPSFPSITTRVLQSKCLSSEKTAACLPFTVPTRGRSLPNRSTAVRVGPWAAITPCSFRSIPNASLISSRRESPTGRQRCPDEEGRRQNDLFLYDETSQQRELENRKTTRTRMTAYLSDDDGKSFATGCCYVMKVKSAIPSATVSKDGSIYIVYDQGRGEIGQHTIFLSKITEQEIWRASSSVVKAF